MVISCLTAYAIAFSCVTLLIGKSYAVTPVQMNAMTRTTDRRGAKIQFDNHSKSMDEPKTNENTIGTEVRGSEGSNGLQTAYSPSKWIGGDGIREDVVGFQNESQPFFASYDPVVNKVTRKLKASGTGRKSWKGRKGEHPWKGKIQNFVAWDTLQDSEREVRAHYNGITVKETVVKTGIDEETGKRQGLKLRQLTDGTNFIQLIYTFDDQIQDCEYIRQKSIVDRFLKSFKEDVEKAKTTYEIENEERVGKGNGEDRKENENEYDDDDDEDDYMEEDEGRIERYWTTGSEEFEGEDVEMGNEYRNVTFQIVQREEDLPEDVADWMDYQMLKRKCRENHKILKQLAYDKRHGNENVKKMAEEHIERMKRAIEISLIFPGTKWCGKSHVAEKYTELGGFSRTDKCCRAHDHCHPLISAFEERYRFYNFRPFTISHCRCDLRRKRDIRDVLMVPGTKWCGKGRRATKYTSLGGFSRTDKCCRVHDTMCPHWIGSLEEKYGLFNWRINTIMHCRCDKRFRACLKMAKTGTANFVGKLFFNVVQTKCFVLKPEEVCLKWSWWGKCEKKEYRKKAYLKDNLSY